MVLAGAVSLSVGCATLLAEKTNSIPIQSSPTHADVYIDGIKRGRTPLTLQLDPRRSYTLVFKKEGLEDKVFDLRNQVGVGWVILDVLLGVFPVIVDTGTGAWHSLEPSSVKVAMLPPGEDAPAGDALPGVPQQGVEQGPPPEAATPTPPTDSNSVNCNLAGTAEWKSASAIQKKKLLEECRRQQGAR
ncbi:putative lipoprotein [Cystobacter fuscus DSM 2262]|uniref:Lipoprotein n=2 Tax=Cystobacter fuscus TaxID=43 RepID=S9PPP4_CYSF2|nr:putative lipoprotein [Cystobacter fuscus DSM 2262]